jgi:hypothetical protein
LPFRKQKGTIRAGAITLADEEMVDQRSVRHVGLDNEGSALLNGLYRGEELDDAGRARLPALFRRRVPRPGGRARAGALPTGVPCAGDDPSAALGLTDTTC